MEARELLVAVAIVWMAIGLGVSFVMGRRGHDLFSWWMLGALFGPLVLVLAVDAAARARSVGPRQVRAGVPGEGPVDVLVGIDGSPESEAALGRVVELLGARIGRLTLAGVVGYDAALAGRPSREGDVERSLRETADRVGRTAGVVVLAGPPAKALTKHAIAEGYDLLSIGSRGRGASKAVLGSVAAQLARAPAPPVLIASS